jgi:hypothetical protein
MFQYINQRWRRCVTSPLVLFPPISIRFLQNFQHKPLKEEICSNFTKMKWNLVNEELKTGVLRGL